LLKEFSTVESMLEKIKLNKEKDEVASFIERIPVQLPNSFLFPENIDKLKAEIEAFDADTGDRVKWIYNV